VLLQFRHDKRVYLGALKYVPHAVLKLLENMPMCDRLPPTLPAAVRSARLPSPLGSHSPALLSFA
jgi:hypothetical protein